MAGGPPDTRLRDGFIGWQCRVRQHAMREYGGRPSPGMRPRVVGVDGAAIARAITVVLVEADPAESIAQFRHIVRRTQDPARRHGDAVTLLSAGYFQKSRSFADAMAALFPAGSPTAAALVRAAACVLEFEQFSQSYRLPCAVEDLAEDDPAFQATLWHNAMFNPAPPGAVRILAFTPDWRRATAHPPV